MSQHRNIVLTNRPKAFGGAVPLLAETKRVRERYATNVRVTRDLQLVKAVETPTALHRYYSQSQHEDVLAARYELRTVNGVERMCLVGIDSIQLE